MAQGRSAPLSSRTSEMEVANTTFIVEKMGAECSPLQFLRELTENAIDSIEVTPKRKGEVRWEVARKYLEGTGYFKLAVVDNGVGMTGEDMIKYIKKLFSSSREQSRYGNFGVGAKFAALPRNPEGLLYLSWKDGVGYTAQLWRDQDTGKYGLRRWDLKDGTVEEWSYVTDDAKPDLITDNGTMVVLLGKSDKDDTMQAPPGAPMPSRWVLRYLNTRYFQFPAGITVRAQEGWEKPDGDKHNFLREVQGQGPWLDKFGKSKGVVQLSTAKAHWWVLKEGVDDDSGHNAGGGHVAALFQDELYEMVTGRAGVARLQGFGVIFGCNRVVLYLEPDDVDGQRVEANTARTHLICNGEPLPWSEWAAEFRDALPQPIAELMEEISAKSSSSDHHAAIKERLKRMRELFHFSRYRPASDGAHRIDDASLSEGGSAKNGNNASGGGGGGRGGRAGDFYALFLATRGGIPAEEVNSPIEPKVDWVTVAEGTRTPPDLEDRAAKFLYDQNLLLINGDFRVFTDMIGRWAKKYAHVPGARPAIEQVTREWFEQQLIEAVMGAKALHHSGRWTLNDINRLWNEEALTSAVLPRYHVDFAISRALGSKLGTLKEQAV